jgi:DNA-binding XRE family transcriptional regulator
VSHPRKDVVAPLCELDPLDQPQFRPTDGQFTTYDATCELGEILTIRRAELHLSQARLAELTGISQADISRIERGKGNPTLNTIRKILDALQLFLTACPVPSSPPSSVLAAVPLAGRSHARR